MNRISIICLGVKDMAQSIRFYRDGLGFSTDVTEDEPKVIFFNTTGTKFELYPLELLAEDINEMNPPQIASGFAGITLAYNVKNEAEVHEIMDLAKKAGATIAKEPQRVFWGGYSGYFIDPNGYYWEVAYNPSWSFDENDMLVL
ncbi:VOC family protein [Aminobacterium sp. MB27-C1]|uniref:VOC family protein n=1 Tax=Aminobacterium sp. MB27-C1 TaxID=3070661 RepID=UPI0027DC6A28|nr:VOC family protein [Aminobacterium sp. MB27-C1]WMI70452.1 VOC family protein [Aminobacterium sp. MB27-C1]